jgi:hypothetical protein
MTNERYSGSTYVLGKCLYAAESEYNWTEDSASVERYDVASNTWTLVANMLEGRCAFGACVIGSAGAAEEQDLFDSLIAKVSDRRL